MCRVVGCFDIHWTSGHPTVAGADPTNIYDSQNLYLHIIKSILRWKFYKEDTYGMKIATIDRDNLNAWGLMANARTNGDFSVDAFAIGR